MRSSFALTRPLTLILGSDEPLEAARRHRFAGIARANAGLLARLGARSRGAVRLAGRGHPRGDHAAALHVRRDGCDRRRAYDLAARGARTPSAIGTTAIAGCATPTSSSRRSIVSARRRRWSPTSTTSRPSRPRARGALYPVYGIVHDQPLDERIAPNLAGFQSAWGRSASATRPPTQLQHDSYGSVILGVSQMFIDERLPRMGDEALYRRLEALGHQARRVVHRAGRGDLGVPRPPARPHAFGHDVLGGARSARPHRLAARPCRGRRAMAAGRRRTAPAKSFRAPGARNAARSPARSTTTSSTPASSCCRSSACSPPTTRAFLRHLRRPRQGARPQRLHDALHQRRLRRGRRRRSSPASSGTSTPSPPTGQRERARELLIDVLGAAQRVRSPVEDIHPETGHLWGNLPQTYSMAGHRQLLPDAVAALGGSLAAAARLADGTQFGHQAFDFQPDFWQSPVTRLAAANGTRRADLSRLVLVSNRVVDLSKAAQAGGVAVVIADVLRDREGLWFGWNGRITQGARRLARRRSGRRAARAATPPRRSRSAPTSIATTISAIPTPCCGRCFTTGSTSRASMPASTSATSTVNRRFADAARSRCFAPDDIVWVHDYHLIPLAAELRKRGVSNPIGFFLHIPVPAAGRPFSPSRSTASSRTTSAPTTSIGLQTKRRRRQPHQVPPGRRGGAHLQDGRITVFDRQLVDRELPGRHQSRRFRQGEARLEPACRRAAAPTASSASTGSTTPRACRRS